jgi:hypothetical protein
LGTPPPVLNAGDVVEHAYQRRQLLQHAADEHRPAFLCERHHARPAANCRFGVVG